MQTVELSRAGLARLQPPMQFPRYDLSHVTAGIVHPGLGGFHRAHMARYTHDLMQLRPNDALAWGVAGASTVGSLDVIDRPAIRIVSLTVTEHGYCLNRSTKELDPEHPLVREDLAHPERPSSAIGIIVEAYRRRRDGGRPAFTALSCDNAEPAE